MLYITKISLKQYDVHYNLLTYQKRHMNVSDEKCPIDFLCKEALMVQLKTQTLVYKSRMQASRLWSVNAGSTEAGIQVRYGLISDTCKWKP